MRHEQGAAFAAAGACRAGERKKYALALGTSGPGATNLITGIADCWLDNIPCLFITGQVNTHEQKGSKKIRQQGFQELEIVDLVKSITKYAVKIKNIDELLPELQKAIELSREGRCGPVLVDIPMDLQRGYVDEVIVSKMVAELASKRQNIRYLPQLNSQVESIKSIILGSSKPLVLLGGGANESKFKADLITCMKARGIPYVASLRGAEKTPACDNYLGMIGSYGTRAANNAIQKCDLLVVIGSRLDVRQTGADTKDFARNSKIIHIDIDSNQLNNTIETVLAITANADEIIPVLIEAFDTALVDTKWLGSLRTLYLASFQDEYPDWQLSPFLLFQTLNELFLYSPVQYVADVGNNQMWAAHSLRLTESQSAHYSGGLGAMGFALPAAIGVQIASSAPTVVITGDGGVQLNIQELDVLARDNLPVLVIVLNNRTLGMVRNFQEMYFEGRNQTTYWGGHSCSFVGIATGYNVESYLVSDLVEIRERINSFITNPRPLLLEIAMLGANECRPRLAYGSALDKQFPSVDFNE
jgi:acetolactate synthase-1/2/3 large subunit